MSSVGKAFDYGGFVLLLSKFRFPGLVLISPLVIFLEVLVFLTLLLSEKKKQAAVLAIILLISSLIVGQISVIYFKGNPCEYYGIFSSICSNLGNFGMHLFQSALLLMSIYVFKVTSNFDLQSIRWKYYIFAGVFVLIAYLVGFTYNSKIDFSHNKSPIFFDYRGKSIVDTPLKNYVKSLNGKKTSMIFCFDFSCNYFWNSIENLKEYNECKTIDTLLLIGTDSFNKKDLCENVFSVEVCFDFVEPYVFNKMFTNSPCTFLVINDTIKYQIPGTLWAHQSIESLLKTN